MNQHVQTAVHFATVEGRVLAAALKPICFVVERRNTYPILAMVKLALDGTTLTITGTDLDIEVSAALDVSDCGGEWETCVSASVLMDIARVAGPMMVRIEPRDRVDIRDGKTFVYPEVVITLDADEAVYTLLPLPADTFPTVPGARGDKVESFTNGQLPAAIARVASAISTEETRYYLNGVCWSVGRWFAATDGHRLFKLNYSADGGTVQHIIPRKTALLLARFFGGADISVFQVKEHTWLDFVAGSVSIRSKIIEGTYPDIERVIPKPDAIKHTIELQPAAISAAIKRVTIMRSKHGGRAVRFFNSGGHVAMEMKNANAGGVSAVLHDSVWPEGLSDFGLNCQYLSDMVRTCEDVVRIGCTDAGSLILFGDTDDAMTRVQMPMRV